MGGQVSGGQAAGGALGAVAGAAIGAVLGGPMGAIQGALIGFSLGYTIGGAIDPPRPPRQPVPAANTDIQVNTYNRLTPLPVVYGYARVWGQVIFVGDIGISRQGGGGGGKKGGSSSPQQTIYIATFAVAVSEGEIDGLDAHPVVPAGSTSSPPATGYGRIWQDDQDRTGFEGLYLTLFEGTTTETDVTGRAKVVLPVPWRRTAYLLVNQAPIGSYAALPQISLAVKGIKVYQPGTNSIYSDLANRPLRATLDYTTNKLYFTLASTSALTPRGLARVNRDGTTLEHTTPPSGFGGTHAMRAWYFGVFDMLIMQDRTTKNKFWFGAWGLSAGSSSWENATFNSKLANDVYAWHTDDLNNHLYLLMRDTTLQTLFVARIDVLHRSVEVHDVGYPTLGVAFADTLPDAVYYDPEDGFLYIAMHDAAMANFRFYRAAWQGDANAITKTFPVGTTGGGTIRIPSVDGLSHAGDFVWIYSNKTTGSMGTVFYYDMVLDRGPYEVAIVGPTDLSEYPSAQNWGVAQFCQPLSELIITRGKAPAPGTIANELADALAIEGTGGGSPWWVITFKFNQIDISHFAATMARYAYFNWMGTPGGAVYDLITNDRYGMGVPATRVDLSSFLAFDGYCTEPKLGLKTDTVQYHMRYMIDVTIADRRTGGEHVKDLLASCLSFLVFSNGKLSVRIDRAFLVLAMRLTDEDFISGSIQVNRASRMDRPNRLRIDYLSAGDTERWRHDVAEANDEFDQNLYGEAREQQLQFLACTRPSQAQRLARLLLISGAYNLTAITFSIGHRGALLEVGDRVDITHTVPGFVQKLFKIADLAESEGDTYQITAIEHNPEVYRNEQILSEPPDPLAGTAAGVFEYVLPVARVVLLELENLPQIRALYSLWGIGVAATGHIVWEGIGVITQAPIQKQGINPATGAPDTGLVPAYNDFIDARSYALSADATAVATALSVATASELGQIGVTQAFPLLAVIESFVAATGAIRQQELVRVTAYAAGTITATRGVTTALAHTIHSVTIQSLYVRQDLDTWTLLAASPSGSASTVGAFTWTSTSTYTDVKAAITGGTPTTVLDKRQDPATYLLTSPFPKIKGLLIGSDEIFNRIDITIGTAGTKQAFALVFLRSTGIDYVSIAAGLAGIGTRNHAHDCAGVVDGTEGMLHTGSIWFDPPRSWAKTTQFNTAKTVTGVIYTSWQYVQAAETVPDATPRYWVMITPIPLTVPFIATTHPGVTFPTVTGLVLKRVPYITIDVLAGLAYDYDMREIGTSVLFHWQSIGRSGQGSVQAPNDEPERSYTVLGLAVRPGAPTNLKLDTDLPASHTVSPATITAADGDLVWSWREGTRFTGFGQPPYGQGPPGYGGTTNPNLQGFRVAITNLDTGLVIRQDFLVGRVLQYRYSSAQNIADNGAYETDLRFEVRQDEGTVLSVAAAFDTT